ncbi:DUF732 domain-containing protein [Pseudonocardia sp.]|jgi:hypothetical protein|uniref:DUF732 domain-containing protein n=1 Tax=Pseudonocardia sp. TaxID=60912 RepID=UPI0031FD9498
MDTQGTWGQRRQGAIPAQRGAPDRNTPDQGSGHRPAGPGIPQQHVPPQGWGPQGPGLQGQGLPPQGAIPHQAGPPTGWRPPAGPQFGPPPPVHGRAPHLPPPPKQRPAWILPTVLSGVVLLAGGALAGITTTALGATSALTASAGARGDAAYLAAVADRPSFQGYTDAQLVDLGHEVCTSLESGTSRSTLVGSAVSAGVGARDALVLVDAASDSYCPAYSRR